MANILTNEPYSPQTVLEGITENCYVMPIDENDIDFIKRIITPLGLMIYPLIEAETAMKISSHDMVAVECMDTENTRYELYLVEVPNDFNVEV